MVDGLCDVCAEGSDVVFRGGTRAGSIAGAKCSLDDFLATGSLMHLGVPWGTTGTETSGTVAAPLDPCGRIGVGGPMLSHGVTNVV